MSGGSHHTLLHYELLAKIGEGGMGEVWRARDTRLDRDVAIKILPESFADDPERLARFEREARAVAALNHPNIVTVHSVEKSEGLHFITMELVAGRPLGELIPRNGLSLAKLFEIGIPLADAVGAAHQQGVTHRDLKPDNVMVTDDGKVKILDFGLAKLEEDAGAGGTQLRTATVTAEGKILGTAAYMSPEQAEGKTVDHRSDIFSLGVMLYQMATGERPFTGDTSVSIITSILRDTPASVTELNRNLPRHVGRIVRQCLHKNPERRFQSAKDLRNQLEELKEEIDSGQLQVGTGAPSARTGRGAWIAVAAVAIVAVISTFAWLKRDRNAATLGSAPLNPSFTQLTSLVGAEESPSLSPDGKTVLYSRIDGADRDIYALRVGGRNPVNLTPGSDADDLHAAFSPDGEMIAFRSGREEGGIFVMGATGESPRKLAEIGYDPAWSPDGLKLVVSTQIFSTPIGRGGTGELWILDVAGGPARHLVTGHDAVQPSWSPGGHRIAYWSVQEGGQREIFTVPAEGGDPRPIVSDPAVDWNPVWAPAGDYLYFVSDRGGSHNIWRVPIDERSGAATGDPRPVTTGVAAMSGYISIARDSPRLAYVSRTVDSNAYRVGFDPASAEVTGSPTAVTRGSTPVGACSPSPGNEWLACSTSGHQEDIFLIRPDGSGRRQLTNDLNKDRFPVWSPDGETIAFYSDRSGSYEIWLIEADGSGLRRVTDTAGTHLIFPRWSPDGKRMFAQDYSHGVSWWIDPDVSWQDQQEQPIDFGSDPGPGLSISPWDWSPDGRKIAVALHRATIAAQKIGVYRPDDKSFEVVLEQGGWPVWLDDRKVLFTNGTEILLGDTARGTSRPLLSVAPSSIAMQSVRVSDDARAIYFIESTDEADIWMLTLDPERIAPTEGQ